MEQAIVSLRDKGYKIGLLTNNGFLDKEKKHSIIIKDLSLFDQVVESCREGVRKPGHQIYKAVLSPRSTTFTSGRFQVMAERLGCEECIFVDDLETNCVAAREVGMCAVQVGAALNLSLIDHWVMFTVG